MRSGAFNIGWHLAAVGAATVLLATVGLLLWPSGTADLSEQRLQLSVPYPVLLLHGLGGKAEDWHEKGLTGFLELKGLRYGGTVAWKKEQGVVIEDGNVRPERGDFFYVQMSDSLQGLDKWTRELRADIREVLARTGAPKVVLLGFSAGGVAARKYVVENPEGAGAGGTHQGRAGRGERERVAGRPRCLPTGKRAGEPRSKGRYRSRQTVGTRPPARGLQ